MAQHRRTLCAADASSPCASAKRQETTECAICGKVVRRGGLARHHKSDACRQAQRCKQKEQQALAAALAVHVSGGDSPSHEKHVASLERKWKAAKVVGGHASAAASASAAAWNHAHADALPQALAADGLPHVIQCCVCGRVRRITRRCGHCDAAAERRHRVQEKHKKLTGLCFQKEYVEDPNKEWREHNDYCARVVFGCDSGAVSFDGVDYAPNMSRAAKDWGYTPIPLPDRDHSGRRQGKKGKGKARAWSQVRGGNTPKAQEIQGQRIEEEDIQRQRIVEKLFNAAWGNLSPDARACLYYYAVDHGMVKEENDEQEEEENIKPKARDVGTQWDPDPDGKIQQLESEQRYRRCQRAATQARLEREAAQKAGERYPHPLDLGNVGGKDIVEIEKARTSGDESD